MHAHHMLKMKKVNTQPIQATLKDIENKWADLEHELPRLQEDIHQVLVSPGIETVEAGSREACLDDLPLQFFYLLRFRAKYDILSNIKRIKMNHFTEYVSLIQCVTLNFIQELLNFSKETILFCVNAHLLTTYLFPGSDLIYPAAISISTVNSYLRLSISSNVILFVTFCNFLF